MAIPEGYTSKCGGCIVCRFLGMVNQVCSHHCTCHSAIESCWSKANSGCGVSISRVFYNIKEILTSSPILALFVPNVGTIVSADAPSFGL